MAILEKPVRQYAGQLDAQLLVKWVAKRHQQGRQ
jgi:hypothetical protein